MSSKDKYKKNTTVGELWSLLYAYYFRYQTPKILIASFLLHEMYTCICLTWRKSSTRSPEIRLGGY
jgi:hypothetical protein